MSQAERDLVKLALSERAEYADFEKWCDENDPDQWVPFQVWLTKKYEAIEDNAEADRYARGL